MRRMNLTVVPGTTSLLSFRPKTNFFFLYHLFVASILSLLLLPVAAPSSRRLLVRVVPLRVRRSARSHAVQTSLWCPTATAALCGVWRRGEERAELSRLGLVNALARPLPCRTSEPAPFWFLLGCWFPNKSLLLFICFFWSEEHEVIKRI